MVSFSLLSPLVCCHRSCLRRLPSTLDLSWSCSSAIHECLSYDRILSLPLWTKSLNKFLDQSLLITCQCLRIDLSRLDSVCSDCISYCSRWSLCFQICSIIWCIRIPCHELCHSIEIRIVSRQLSSLPTKLKNQCLSCIILQIDFKNCSISHNHHAILMLSA